MTTTPKHPNKTNPTRRLTICSKGFPRRWGAYINFPSINLSGKWLQENGFKIGHVVDISCAEGKLTIIISPEQRFDRFKKTS